MGISGKVIWEDVKPEVKALVEKLVLSALVPALEQVVADSTNKYDDAFLAMFEPILKNALKEQLGHL